MFSFWSFQLILENIFLIQDGKPYILSVDVGIAQEDQRAQGFTIAAISTFASLEDMQYYDNECAAHKSLREYARSVSQGFCMVYFNSLHWDSPMVVG